MHPLRGESAPGMNRPVSGLGVETGRLYGAPAAFNHTQWFLMGRHPTVLQLERTTMIDFGSVHAVDWMTKPGWRRHPDQRGEDWPRAYGSAGGAETFPLRFFNPSVVRLQGEARNLCQRCAYAAAVRADSLHQCPGTWKHVVPRRIFHGTIIAILDNELKVLGWTWMLSAPYYQIRTQAGNKTWDTLNDTLPNNVSDGFAPSWARLPFDTRLLNVGDRAGSLLAIYTCSSCQQPSIGQLNIWAQPTNDGGLTNLQAWVGVRPQNTDMSFSRGRNQALFVHFSTKNARPTLYMQSWFGVIGTCGDLRTRQVFSACKRSVGSITCGAHVGPLYSKTVFAQKSWQLIYNYTSSPELRHFARLGLRVSSTSNMLRVRRQEQRGNGERMKSCEVLLGVGHMHRSDTRKNMDHFLVPTRYRQAIRAHRHHLGLGPIPFRFGCHYTHFFYALRPQPPFKLIALSQEFCIESSDVPGDCESVQFVGGLSYSAERSQGNLTDDRDTHLLLSFGVNDCEAKVGMISVERVWSMLRPARAGVSMESVAQCSH